MIKAKAIKLASFRLSKSQARISVRHIVNHLLIQAKSPGIPERRTVMRRCSRCVLPETYPNTYFNEQGVCNHCLNHREPAPLALDPLLGHIKGAKKRSRGYDALIPLSGGKDSTYVLYLATKVYGLRVLAFTFDNGFLSETALASIESALQRTGVDHLFFKPNWDIMRRLYRSTLIRSGELCSACGIGMEYSITKASADWHIPLILTGNSAMERESYSPENIYDIKRFKTIVADAGEVSEEELNRFLIYPDLSPDRRLAWTILGKLGQTLTPLEYGEKKTEVEIGKLLTEEMGWQDRGKHSDCWAEPFSNLVRELRLGYSRRACQLSNLIRASEMTRETALALLSEQRQAEVVSREKVLDRLELSASDMDAIASAPAYQYEGYVTPPMGSARQLAHRLAIKGWYFIRHRQGTA
jgi:hypothetical protein